jgi:putative FmdB family regulatory protein
MPLYEYKCHKCGLVFEVLQKFADAPLDTHVACGGAVERLISAPTFQFKGTGFYITDYAKKNSSNGSSHTMENTPSASAKAPATTKSESKPSASAEPAAKR